VAGYFRRAVGRLEGFVTGIRKETEAYYIGMTETRRINLDQNIPSLWCGNWNILYFVRFIVLLSNNQLNLQYLHYTSSLHGLDLRRH